MNTNSLNLDIKWIASGIVAVLVIIGIVGIVRERSESREREASNMLYELSQQAQSLAKEKKFEDAASAYGPLLKKYPRSRAAFDAELQIGDIYSDARKPQEASSHYKNAESIAPDSFSKALSQYNLGAALENAAQYKEAVSEYESAMKNSELMQPELLLAAARCYEKLGMKEKALANYNQIKEKFANRTGYYSGAASALSAQLSAGN